MKNKILIAIIAGLLLGFTGCGTSSEKDGKVVENKTEAIQTENAVNLDDVSEENGNITEDQQVTDEEVLSRLGTPIPEQTFEITLDAWGTVVFASFAPENSSFLADGQNPDVRFCLVDDGEVLYEFPGLNEEHTNSDLFLTVSAVAFKDYNEDGLLDVITLCEYEAMSGEGFQAARIYFQMEDNQGFEEDPLLTEYLSKNDRTDSIVTIIEAKEDYWEYFESMNGQRGIYNQLIVMAENKELWADEVDYANEVYQYAVADLDRNGRYEVIVSNMGGTGHFTYSRFFEINESYDGLVECETDFIEGDSQPDIISGKLDTYMDENGELYYAVYDFLKNGAAEYYENVRALWLKDGKIHTASIAYRTTIYSAENGTITCKDADGNIITEEAYNHAAETYFTGFEKKTTSFGWQDMKELAEDVAEITAQLDASYNIYAYSD